MSSVEADLLTGVATTLAGTVGTRQKYTYREVGAYSAADGVGIHIDIDPEGELPTLTLTEYVVGDDIVGGDQIAGVQFRIAAADRRVVKDVISDLYDVFHARWGGSLGSIKLIAASRSSGANLGQDAGRLIRTENYYLTIYRR